MLERTLSDIHISFMYDIRRATSMLMYALAGIEAYQRQVPVESKNYIPASIAGIALSSSSEPGFHFLLDSAKQLAYKGWVEEVYGLWENKHRNHIEAVFSELTEEAIRPEINVMGDFRHIRNDLVHSGVASEEETGKCVVLQWFAPGAPIVFRFDHVLDFLNQISALAPPAIGVMGDPSIAKMHSWYLHHDEETLRSWQPEPVLVSAVAGEGPTEDTLGVRVVFDNGVSGAISLYSPDGSDASRLRNAVRLSQDGRALLIGEGGVSASDLYGGCIDQYFHPEQRTEGPGMSGPMFRFARPKEE